MVTGLKCSQKPYIELSNYNDYYKVSELIDEFSPEVLKSVQQFLSNHKEMELPMGEIKERFSRTMNDSYMSFGCPRCDAIVGDHYFSDMKMEYMYESDDELVFDIPIHGPGIQYEQKHFIVKL